MGDPSRVTFVTPASGKWSGRNLKPWLLKITATLVLVIFVTVSLHGHWPLALALVCCSLGFWWLNDIWQRYCDRMEILEDVDQMTAEEFRSYAAELLRTQGYTLSPHSRATQIPADLLLARGAESIACWVYHGHGPVRVEFVAKATAAVQAWAGWRFMVFSSRRFTLTAWYRARREGCLVSNRSSLASLVTQYRRGHRVLAFPYAEMVKLRSRK